MNREIVKRIARDCYIPTNALLLKLVRKHPNIKITFSISGVILEQLEEFAPDVLDSFRALASTGSIEFLSEPYYHSLACMISPKEFETQVKKHTEKIQRTFGVRPTVFRNTELIYSDDIVAGVNRLGFVGVITDGVEKVLGKRSPNHVYHHPCNEDLKILLRNYRLSDDIGFRYNENGEALTAEKYVSWVTSLPKHEEVITLALDYETFGEHWKKESGIFRFLEDVLVRMSKSRTFEMVTASTAIMRRKSSGPLSVAQPISWADHERDLSAWLGNDMQRDAFDTLAALEPEVKSLNDPIVLEAWRNLQISDHFYYMSTKRGSDGTVHSYFSPYPSPYEAFINYMNVLSDFSIQVKALGVDSMAKINDLESLIHPTIRPAGKRMTMLVN